MNKPKSEIQIGRAKAIIGDIIDRYGLVRPMQVLVADNTDDRLTLNEKTAQEWLADINDIPDHFDNTPYLLKLAPGHIHPIMRIALVRHNGTGRFALRINYDPSVFYTPEGTVADRP
jgi:hypothetical protein